MLSIVVLLYCTVRFLFSSTPRHKAQHDSMKTPICLLAARSRYATTSSNCLEDDDDDDDDDDDECVHACMHAANTLLTK